MPHFPARQAPLARAAPIGVIASNAAHGRPGILSSPRFAAEEGVESRGDAMD